MDGQDLLTAMWGWGAKGGLEAGLGLWVASGLSLQGETWREQVAVSGVWVRGLGGDARCGAC